LNVELLPKFQSVGSFARNDWILNSAIVHDFQDSKVLMSIP